MIRVMLPTEAAPNSCLQVWTVFRFPDPFCPLCQQRPTIGKGWRISAGQWEHDNCPKDWPNCLPKETT